MMHPTPRGRDVVLEQVRIVGLGLRSMALVVAVVLGIVTLAIAADIVRGNAETWFDSDDWAAIALVSFLLPFAVWRREKRFGPAFLWTLPVDRRRLALAKVCAGWLWLMIALAVLILWQLALAALSGVAGAQTVPLIAFVGATALYLLGSALVLGLRHPLRWLLGTVSVLFLLGLFDEARGPHRVDAFLRSIGFFAAADRVAEVWPFLCLGVGLIALWAAISRHRENR